MVDVTVSLSGSDIYGNTLHLTTLTDSSGMYLFPDLIAGTYVITIQPGSGYSAYYDLDGTGTALSTLLTLTAGQVRTDIDFALKAGLTVGSVGDTVWLDLDRDGIYDLGESTLSGVLMTLSGTTWDNQPFIGSQVTNSSGQYLFGLVPAGTYTITASGMAATLFSTYDLDGTGTLHTTTFALSSGQARTDIDFGYMYASSSL
jgi:hypothetical protein